MIRQADSQCARMGPELLILGKHLVEFAVYMPDLHKCTHTKELLTGVTANRNLKVAYTTIKLKSVSMACCDCSGSISHKHYYIAWNELIHMEDLNQKCFPPQNLS